jgi:hypothetical protein
VDFALPLPAPVSRREHLSLSRPRLVEKVALSRVRRLDQMLRRTRHSAGSCVARTTAPRLPAVYAEKGYKDVNMIENPSVVYLEEAR